MKKFSLLLLAFSTLVCFAEKNTTPPPVTAPPAPICDTYVTSIKITRGDVNSSDTSSLVGSRAVTFSSGKTFSIGRQYWYRTDNGESWPTAIEIEPTDLVTLLTASYLNKKPICYTLFPLGTEIQSVQFQ